MQDENQVDSPVAPTATPEAPASEPSHTNDPVAAELERVTAGKPKRTKLEQLEFTKKRVDDQLAEERRKAGIEDDDSRPLTVAEFKALQVQTAQETALKLTETRIENETERKLVQFHLEHTIKPSGDPETDLRNGLALVNALKNTQIAAETVRTAPKPRAAGSAAGAPPKEKQTVELTKEEQDIKRGFGLTDDEVVASRQAA